MLSVTDTDGPAFNTRIQTHECLSLNTSTSEGTVTIPNSLTANTLQALLQMQKTDSFCKRISKCLSNGKAPQDKTDLFMHVRGLLYKHIAGSGKKILTLVIPKSLKCTVLVEVHDKLGHQGTLALTVL